MKKHEFLRELENSLKGNLSEMDISEILSDYDDIFEDGLLENRDEDEISESIGSPAAISKAIVDESTHNTVTQSVPPVTKDISNLAPMSKRFLAYLIDTTLVVVLLMSLFMVGGSTITGSKVTLVSQQVTGDNEEMFRKEEQYRQRTYLDKNKNIKKIKFYRDEKKIFSGNKKDFDHYIDSHNIDQNLIHTRETSAPMFSGFGPRLPIVMLIPYLLIFMAIGVGNILTAFELWIFNGYTLGKWITKIRVVRLDEDKLTFWDGFLRDIVLKFFGAAITSGILNMVSFVLGCATPDHKTIHDMAAKTKVININR